MNGPEFAKLAEHVILTGSLRPKWNLKKSESSGARRKMCLGPMSVFQNFLRQERSKYSALPPNISTSHWARGCRLSSRKGFSPGGGRLLDPDRYFE